MLESEFIKTDKKYGLILLYEGLGHRHGDLAVVSRDSQQEYLDLMRGYYTKSHDIASEIKCAKQMFVLWFWMGCYYYKVGNKDEAGYWLKKFHKGFRKYSEVSRVFYKDKMKVSLRVIKDCLGNDYGTYRQKFISRSKHPKLTKILKEMK